MRDAISVDELGNDKYKVNGAVWTHDDLEMMLSIFFKCRVTFDNGQSLSMLLIAKKMQEEENEAK